MVKHFDGVANHAHQSLPLFAHVKTFEETADIRSGCEETLVKQSEREKGFLVESCVTRTYSAAFSRILETLTRTRKRTENMHLHNSKPRPRRRNKLLLSVGKDLLIDKISAAARP
jgi:hypothetical protein